MHDAYTRWAYVWAYARVFSRTTTWVTLMCVLMFVPFTGVPQAGELILSQATRPAADEASGGFYWRMLFVNLAAGVLAFSCWLSARVLVRTEAKAYGSPAAHSPDDQAARYVPRQLGLSVFLILQLAAAGGLSPQGYYLPIVLVGIWLVLLVLGLMRTAPEVDGRDLRAWWFGLLAAMFVLAVGAFLNDWQGLAKRNEGPGPIWLEAQQDALRTMGYLALAISVLLCAATPLICGGARSGRVQAGLSIAGLVGVGYAFYSTEHLSLDDMYWLFFLGQSTMAAVYWLLVVRRRDIARWMKQVPWLASVNDLSSRHVWAAVTGFVALATALLALWAAWHPIAMGSYFGALGIVLMFLAFLVLFVALIQSLLGSFAWGRTMPAGLVGFALLFLLFAVPTPPEAPRSEVGPVTVRTAGQDVRQLPADGKLFALAAHGGGIRAAQYTAAFAAWLDHETDYRFSEGLVAASGASGGSVGLAVWSAARAAGCRGRKVEVESGTIPACVQAVNQTLSQDHLGPLIASGLYRDYLQFFRNPERGNTLQQSILHAASQVHPDAVRTKDGIKAHLQAPLLHAYFPLLLNSAHVGTARPYALVTRKEMLPPTGSNDRSMATIFESADSEKVSLLTAAMHSARFPLISPKGLVSAEGPAVVDGGYFDNSGVAALRQYLTKVGRPDAAAMEAMRKRMVIISLDSEPIASTPPPRANDGRNSFSEVVATILAARAWHGLAAWKQMCADFPEATLISARPGAPLGGCEWPAEDTPASGKYQLWQVQSETRSPALGWHLSRRSTERVSDDARRKAREVAGQVYGLKPVPSVPAPTIQRALK